MYPYSVSVKCTCILLKYIMYIVYMYRFDEI